MTHQNEFGGLWTQQKLEVLSKYLPAYTRIFRKNPRAQFYTTSYVDAFAGTGVLRRPALGGIAKLIPGIAEAEEEFRKGSVRRALEVKPPFDKYVLIEKNAKKCRELKALAAEFPEKQIEVIEEDANLSLIHISHGALIRTHNLHGSIEQGGRMANDERPDYFAAAPSIEDTVCLLYTS